MCRRHPPRRKSWEIDFDYYSFCFYIFSHLLWDFLLILLRKMCHWRGYAHISLLLRHLSTATNVWVSLQSEDSILMRKKCFSVLFNFQHYMSCSHLVLKYNNTTTFQDKCAASSLSICFIVATAWLWWLMCNVPEINNIHMHTFCSI